HTVRLIWWYPVQYESGEFVWDLTDNYFEAEYTDEFTGIPDAVFITLLNQYNKGEKSILDEFKSRLTGHALKLAEKGQPLPPFQFKYVSYSTRLVDKLLKANITCPGLLMWYVKSDYRG